MSVSVSAPAPAPFAPTGTVASLAGHWCLTITEIAGDDAARWTIGAVALRLAPSGTTVRGTVRNTRPDIACTSGYALGEAIPPVPPMGPIEGHRAGDGLTLVLGRHWELVGTLDAAGTRVTGTATYRERVQGRTLERRGGFTAVRLPR